MDAELRAEHDLPLCSFDVLFQLALAPGSRLRLSELTDRVPITLSGISRPFDRLEREGLVRRETDPEDRRSYYAMLTVEGEARLCRAQFTHVARVWSPTPPHAPAPIPAHC